MLNLGAYPLLPQNLCYYNKLLTTVFAPVYIDITADTSRSITVHFNFYTGVFKNSL